MLFSIHDDLVELRRYGLIYLASPYSKYPYGIDEAFHDICLVTGRLIMKGLNVFSPIAHTHPIAKSCNADPFDYKLWQPSDDAVLDRCDAMLVVKMSGWELSTGVEYEMNRFTKKDDLHFLNPGTYR